MDIVSPTASQTAPPSPPTSEASEGTDSPDFCDQEEYTILVREKARYLREAVARVNDSIGKTRKNVLPSEYYKIAAEMCDEEKEVVGAPLRSTRSAAKARGGDQAQQQKNQAQGPAKGGENPQPPADRGRGQGGAGGAGGGGDGGPGGGRGAGGGGGGGGGDDGDDSGDSDDGGDDAGKSKSKASPCSRPMCIAARTELAASQAQVSDYSQKIAELAQSIKAGETKYKTAMTKAKNEKERLRAELTAEVDKTTAAQVAAREAKDNATSAIKAAEEEASKAKADAAEAYEVAKSWKERATAADQRPCKVPEHERLEERVKANEERAQKLEGDLQGHRDKYEALLAEHQSCAPHTTWDELKAAVKRANDAQNAAKQHKDDLVKAKAAAAAQVADLEEALEAAKDAAERESKARKEAEASAARNGQGNQSEEVAALQRELAAVKVHEAKKRDIAKADMDKRLQTLEADLDSALAEATDAKKHAEAAKAQKRAIEEQLSKTEERLKQAQTAVEGLTDIFCGECAPDDISIFPNQNELQAILDEIDALKYEAQYGTQNRTGAERYKARRRIDALRRGIEEATFARTVEDGTPRYLAALWEQAGNKWIESVDALKARLVDGEGGEEHRNREKRRDRSSSGGRREQQPRREQRDKPKRRVSFADEASASPSESSEDEEEETNSDSTQASPVKQRTTTRRHDSLPPPWNTPTAKKVLSFGAFSKRLTAEIVKPFTGKLEEYPRFRAHFISAFHEKGYAPVDKYHALMKYAGSAVPDLADTLTPSEEAYYALIRRLEEEFGGQERQIVHFSQQIKACAKIRGGAVKDMQRLVDAVQSYHAALPRGQEHEKHAIPHGAEVLAKLDSDLQLAFRQYCSAHGLKPLSAPNIVNWLRKEQISNLLQDRSRPNRPESGSGARPRRGAAFSSAEQQGDAALGACPLCGDWHTLGDCATFLGKGPDSRRNLALAFEACLKCLRGGHLANECDATTCAQCNGNHHVLLCGGKRPGRKQSQQQQKKGRKQQSGDKQTSEGKPDLASAAKKPAPPTKPGEDGLYTNSEPAGDPSTSRVNLMLEVPRPAETTMDVAQAAFTGREHSFAQANPARSPAYVSLRYAVLKVRNPVTGKAALVNALIDGGASLTTLAGRAADFLGLQGQARELTITGYGGVKTECTAVACKVELQSQNEQLMQEASITVVDDPVGELYATNWKLYKDLWPHLADVPVAEPMGNGRVLMIVGADNLFFQRVLEEAYGTGPNDPVAQLTPLGWTISGLTRPLQTGESLVTMTAHSFDVAHEVHPWEAELLQAGEARGAAKIPDPDVRPLAQPEKGTLLSAADRKAVNIIAASRTKKEDGTVEVRPLWAGEKRPGNNYEEALADWRRNAESLRRRDLLAEYRDAFKVWLDKGFVTKCTGEKAKEGFFLKHFPVIRRDNVTTKVRIVANGAAPYKGVSLNDCMMAGPKVINSLVQVLLRFRREKVAIASDISAMFLSVAMPVEDSFFHKFVISLRGEDPEEFQSVGHVFGSSGSLTVCVTVLKLAALELRHTHPEAAAAVLYSSMVDDVLSGARSRPAARDLGGGLQAIAAAAGLTMHKWASNDPAALPLGAEKRKVVEIKDKTENQASDAHKSLGVLWDSDRDQLAFNRRETLPTEYTKLTVLKAYMSVFDPVGAILPFVMGARLMYSDLWSDGGDWDDPLPAARVQQWRKWFDELDNLPRVKLARWVKPNRGDKIVAFSDASSGAYGAVVYLSGPAGVRFIYSRARINSNAGRTIPLLELLGAEVAVICVREVARALEMSASSAHYFTDSRNVLTWVRRPSRDVSPHMARKIAQIREATHPPHWHFVPTLENPADLVTRGLSLAALLDHDLWWEGPPFVGRPPSAWPAHGIPAELHPSVPEEDMYERLIGIYAARGMSTAVRKESAVKDTSKWRVAVRAIARLWCVLNNWMLALRKQEGPRRRFREEDDWLPLLEVEQRLAWPVEYQTLAAGRTLPAKHPWRAFSTLWEKGVIWVEGRTGENRRPLVQGASHLGELLMRHVHGSSLQHCGGHKAVLAFARKTFWILGGDAAARRAIRKCADCRRTEPKFSHPREAPLPLARTGGEAGQAVFTHIMVDFFGPLLTHHGRGRARTKRWVLVATCLAVRAVALELTQDRSSKEVRAALSRIAFKYGVPKHITSDNAAEFVAAAAELKAGSEPDGAGELGDWTKLSWQHYPPYAPNFGGAVEAIVGIAKKYLAKLSDRETTTDLGLHHQLAHAEGILNLRPIGTISNHPYDPEPITAGHLLGTGKLRVRDINPKGAPAAWKEVVQHAEEAWETVLQEALPALFKTKKWRNTVYACKPGDIVVVALHGAGAGVRWPLGRVLEVRRGSDGVARRAIVLVGGKQIERAVAHLCPLF